MNPLPLGIGIVEYTFIISNVAPACEMSGILLIVVD